MKIKRIILSALLFGAVAPASIYATDYVDDIYFNPKKDKTVGAKKKNSNYIENFSDMDVDTYNLRGQYYSSPIDTVGSAIGAEEDFVYTQQIQKYYNPTIVLDNSELLADVLENSYGNVEVVYNGLTPAFMPVYSYGWPYYGSYYNPWAWNVGFGGWNIGGWYDPWYWGPSWSWGWGPSWSWGPSWGWGPSWNWGWGPGWGNPGWVSGWHRPNSTWSPGGNRPVRPGAGWATSTRPGSHRPNGTAGRPGSGNPNSGSQWSIGGNHRVYSGQTGVNSNKNNAYGSGNNRGYVIGNDGHRYSGSNSSNGHSGVNNNRNTGNHRTSGSNYNSNRTSNSTRSNSGSYNSGRSSGNGSFGSGSFGGGGHRSGGGSTSRGGRR